MVCADVSAKGRLAAQSPEAASLKSAKMIAHRDAMENWNPAELPEWLDDNYFLMKIRPALASIRKSMIADALGMSVSVAYKFANGTRIPHRRHWVKLAGLIEADRR
ncbi:MAG TPA: hypothetical protein VF283_23810 [Bryobacteraceae bacterium]